MRTYRIRKVARAIRDLVPTPRGGGLVLMYHRAADLDVDPYRMAVSPAHLAEHLEILARSTRPITAGCLAASLDAGRIPDGTTVVTFDDGYADLATEVRPLLERIGVHATMFITSSAVDRPREFWWDVLDRVLLEPHPVPQHLRLRIDEETLEWDLGGDAEGLPPPARDASGRVVVWRAWHPPPTARHRVHRELWVRLRSLPTLERERAVDSLLAWAGLDPTARPSHRTLRADELAAIVDGGLVEIGAHTVTHPSLGSLPVDAQREEIESSRASLEALLGRPVPSLAYPYGAEPDVTPDTVTLAREAGFTSAYVTAQGRVREGSDRHALPRIFVPDLDGEDFSKLLLRTAGIRAR
jgi:peptidoglycan/xylan/chitin deacetylase (PgdA/CDA1 family)